MSHQYEFAAEHAHEHGHTHEHSHSHSHAHTHEDGTPHAHTHEHSHSHSHAHTHEDGTTHAHTHEHTHSHEHCHDGEHAHTHAAGTGGDRDRKILEYMIGHNAEHACEMKDLAGRLRQAGRTSAADLIEEAARGFESANAGLQKAADLLG